MTESAKPLLEGRELTAQERVGAALPGPAITRLLVANRGEIASRVFRTCRAMGIETVAIHSDPDAGLPYVREADFAVHLPGSSPTDTYLRADLVIDAARRAGANAVHPGYGFLSENASFARAVIHAGLVWVGPAPESIDSMGSKIGAKAIMKAAGVPVLEAPSDPTEADLPLLVKASAGGGGRGMRVVRSLDDLDSEIAKASAEAGSAFGDGTVFVEPYVEHGRHVEVQLMGTTVYGDRDCSIQRRHQKVVEEAPAPGLPDDVRAALHEAARKAAEAIDYSGAGTVEFLYDEDKQRFWFLEMNTRLQVEHPVTEAVFGVDLVEQQIAVAPQGSWLMGWSGEPNGHAIEVRLYAEDPADGYAPQAGRLTRFEIPVTDGIRVEAGYATGDVVSTFYDPMIAKVIAWAPSREAAARKLAATLRRAKIHGLRTNREQLVEILTSRNFLLGWVSTAFLSENGPNGLRDGGPHAQQGDAEARSVRLAAAIALAESAKAARRVQQAIPVGWRSVTSQPQRTEFEDGTVAEWFGERGGYRAEGVRVVRTSPTTVTLERDGVATTYDVAIVGDRVEVDSPHGHTALQRKPRFVDPATQVAAGSLLAPMPGSVVAVHVSQGDDVVEGQALLVMEAMKMQHTITATAAGTVAEVVAQGQQVEAGTVLAVISTGSISENSSINESDAEPEEQE